MAELTKLGRYELRSVLGRGAMGVVYEGFDPTLGRRVAVKTILKSAAIDSDTERAYSERFVREAKAVGRLNHPNIVQVHDFGEQNEVAYLVMEFIQGRELRSYFDAGEIFDMPETVRIMGELLDALEFAHEAGVVHRDVKPANVMLDAQRRVKLADFGVARVQDGAERSQAGTMVGTPAFMSPEQISGRKLDRRTDVFSAGIVLYQLLTGEQPFKGEGAWTVARKIMQEDPPQPSSLVTNILPEYDAIVAKALAKSPGRRYASAKEFATELRGVLGGIAPVLAMVPPKPATRPEAKASDAEVEFWRAIQNSNDPDELEFYLEQFPTGTYSQLARHKIAKLRHLPEQDPSSTASLQAEAQAKLLAEQKARQESEAKTRRDAEEQARRRTAQREAEEQSRLEAEAKARREAKIRAELENATMPIGGSSSPGTAARKTSFVIPSALAVLLIAGVGAYFVLANRPAPVAQAPVAPKVEAPASVAPPRTEVSAAEIEKIRKETEERIRREYADKSAAEQASVAKAATDKAVQEKQGALKAAADKIAVDKAVADKIAAEKAAFDKAVAEKVLAAKSAAERAAAEHAVAEKLAAEKAAADKLAAEKAAAEKAAAEKVAAEKAAAAKAAAGKPGWPHVGDHWVYEVREQNNPERRFQISVDIQAVTANSVRELVSPSNGAPVSLTHGPGAFLASVANGVANFVPYLRAFHEIRGDEKWPRIEYKTLWTCGTVNVTCSPSARIAGRERVTVRAGTFETWKIVVDLNAHVDRGSGAGELYFWYSEEARRIVKYQSRTTLSSWLFPAAWTQSNTDMELVSFRLAPSR